MTPDELGMYTRVSTEKQALRTSPQVQLEANQAWAVAQFGFKVPEVNIYQEPGRTGASLTKRPVMQRLLQHVESGRLKVVIFHSLDRNSRNLDVLFHIRSVFMEAGAAGLCVVENGLDISTSDTNELIGLVVYGLKSQIELSDLTRRMKSGREVRMQAGMASCGGVDPYGLKRVRHTTPGGQSSVFFELNEEEARICHMIKDMLLRGHPCQQIAQELERLHIPPASVTRKRQAGRWAASQVHRILSDDIRRGEYQRGEFVIPVPAIFSAEDAAAIDAQLAENSDLYSHQRTYQYLLTSRLKCARCGYTYCGGTSRNKYGSVYRFYRCALRAAPRRYNGQTCPESKSIKADIIEEMVWSEVVRVLTTPDALQELAERQASGLQENLGDRIEALTREVDTIERELDGLISVAAQDKGRHFERVSRLLDAKDDELSAKRALLGQYRAELRQERKQRSELEQAAEHMAVWSYAVTQGDLPFEKRRQVLRAVVDHIDVLNETFTVYANLLCASDIHAARMPWMTLTLPEAVRQ